MGILLNPRKLELTTVWNLITFDLQGIFVKGGLLFSVFGIEFGRLFEFEVDEDNDGLEVLKPEKFAFFITLSQEQKQQQHFFV